MELQGERPVWSMSGSEKLAALDAIEADLARRQTYRLHLIAGLDHDGYAKEVGAHDTVQLLAFRYRLDRPQARRDLRLAQTLSKYPAVTAALPAVGHPAVANDPADPTNDAHEEPADDSPEPTNDPDAADDTAALEGFLRPAQAEAIVSALERVPATVPVEDLDVAERELVALARHLSPGELRKAGQRVRDVLDTDGPEPDEHRAYTRESLTLMSADRGVKFRGYLANENAELLRSLIHAGARPHRTVTGDLDPRPRDKRQADALTTALTLAATAYDTNPTAARTTAAAAHGVGATPAGITTAHTTDAGTADAGAAAGAGLAGAADAGAASAGTADATGAAGAGLAGAVGTDAVNGTGRADAGTASAGTADGATGAGRAGDGATGAGREGAGRAGGGTPGMDETTGAGRADWIPGFGARANITVTIDLQDLKSAAADAIGDVVYGDGLSAATIRRLACDAKIIPLVLGSKSEPLDVGRAQRLVTGAMRRALNARDRGCVVCGAPPVQCDAHHLQSWIDGGATAVSNLALLCRRHHVDLHDGEWTITITDGQVHVARPSWADPPPQHTRRQTRNLNPDRPQSQPVTLQSGAGPSSDDVSSPHTGRSPSGSSGVASRYTGPHSSGSSCLVSSHVGPNPSAPSRMGSPTAPGSATPQPGPGSRSPEIGPGSTTPEPGPGTRTPEPGPGFRTPELGPSFRTPEAGPGSTPSAAEVAVSDGCGAPSHATGGIRGGIVHRLLLAGSEGGGVMAPSAVREAVSLAIWGEALTQTGEEADSDGSGSGGDRAGGLGGERVVDPWGEGAGVLGAA
jgi:hypothetical protein